MKYAINEEIKFAMAIERAKFACEKHFRLRLVSMMFERGIIFWPRLVRAKGSETTIRTKLPEAIWVKDPPKYGRARNGKAV